MFSESLLLKPENQCAAIEAAKSHWHKLCRQTNSLRSREEGIIEKANILSSFLTCVVINVTEQIFTLTWKLIFAEKMC